MPQNLRSIRFSAECLGVSVFTVRRLIAQGAIKTVNVGARLMIPDAELDRIGLHGVGHRKSRKRTTKR